MLTISKIINIHKSKKISITQISCDRIAPHFTEIMPRWLSHTAPKIFATSLVRKMYTCQNYIIWILCYHFMMLWKGYKNFDFLHKLWKAYLEWYTSALGMKYFKHVPRRPGVLGIRTHFMYHNDVCRGICICIYIYVYILNVLIS